MNAAQIRHWLWPLLLVLVRIGAALMVSALLALAAVVMTLRTDGATRWVLERVQTSLPELTLTGLRGNLIDGLHVDALRWETPDLALAITPLDLRLSWANLLRGRATLDPLRIGRLSIEPRGPDSDEPIVLPTLVSPLALHAQRLQVAELVIRSGATVTTLRDLDTGVFWLGPTLHLRQPRLAYEQFTLIAGRGRITFTGAYPLALSGTLTSADLPGPVAVTAGGDLRALRLDADLSGPWPLRARATLHTLESNLPFSLDAALARPIQRDLGVDIVTARSLALQAKGDLDRFDGTVKGQLNDQRYGDSQLAGSFARAGDTLRAQAHLALAQGNLRSDCALNASDEQWQCAGAVERLPLTPWLNGRDAEVSTPFTLAGRLGMPIDLQIELAELSGRVGELAVSGALRAQSPDLERWTIAELQLDAGANHLKASGSLDQHSDLHVQIAAPRLAELYAGISGAFTANIAVSGPATTPGLRGNLMVHDLRYGDTHLRSGQSRFTIAALATQPSDITVVLSGLELAGTQLGLDATLRGTRAHHTWRATLGEQHATAELGCTGDLAASRYGLECRTLRGTYDITAKKVVPWSLRAPLVARWDFARDEGGVDGFCLGADPASLCVRPGLYYRQHQLQAFDAALTQLPLRWWRRALPDGLRLRNQPQLGAHINFVSQRPLQLRARATLDASEWRWFSGEEPHTLQLDPITANVDLAAKEARLGLALDANAFGRARANLTVAEPMQARRLAGRVELQALQLAALGWLLPDLQVTSGQIDGGVDIAGTAAQPILAGQFTLANGEVDLADLGDPLRELGAQLRFDNQRADLTGQFRLGDGQARLTGNTVWSGGYTDWRTTLRLQGNGLQIEPLIGSTVVFAPDLTLDAAPDDLRLHGQVAIERADIRLQQLPPETVNPSRDTRVSGRESDEEGLPLTLDVGLDLGQKTHFAGFGAEVDLAGRLQLKQEKNRELAALGRIDVTKGRYRAYGQRLIVRKGQFIFTGNLDNPDLNLEAIRELPPGNTDVVGLRVTGSLRDPLAQLFSDQSLSESDVAYYLLTGRKRDPNQDAGGFSAGGTLLSLGLSRSEDQAARLAEKFGIRGLTLGTAAGNDGTTEAEVSGYLFRDLYVRYGRSLGENADSVTLQYQLTPKLMIQSISGIEEVLELIYTFTLD